MKEVTQQHAGIDRFIAKTFAENPEMKPCCSVGCSACCSEPVYAGEAEVLHILECLTPEQTTLIKTKLPGWLAKTKPLMNQNMPDATEYRKLNTPCVLLNNGLCSVYPRRPMGCRVWFAVENPDHCELPYRTHQKYAKFDTAKIVHASGDSLVFIDDRHVLDHLGNLLAEKLLGIKTPSASRITDTLTSLTKQK